MKKFTLAFALLLSVSALAQSGGVDLQGDWKVVGWTLPDFVPVKNHLPKLTIKGNMLSGTAGCNKINGTVTISGNKVTFGPITSTRMSCGDAVAKQEAVFLKALSGQTLTAERIQDSLTLDTGTQGMLNIRRMTIQGK